MSQKLDKIDKRILYELDKNSRISEARLAKIIRKSRETVRYRMRQLEKEGIILRYFAYIDVTRLGYRIYKMYIKLGGTPEKKQQFYDYVKGHQNVFWFGVADGAWNAGITFFARSDEEFNDVKNELVSCFKDIILERTGCVLINVLFYPKKFLVDGSADAGVLFGENEGNAIDGTDRKILGILLHNARAKTVEIAKKCGTSADIVRNRMKRLEERKIIFRYTVDLDIKKLDLEFFKAFLFFNGISGQDERKLEAFCSQNPSVVFLVRHILPWDIELEAYVKNYAEYNAIIDDVRRLFPHNLRNVETAIFGQDYYFPSKKTIFD